MVPDSAFGETRMNRAHCPAHLYLAVAAFLMTLHAPLPAQDDPALDFWFGVGRFVRSYAELTMKPDRPPDLSGTHQVHGYPDLEDTTESYDGELTMKKARTITTPQGARLNLYEVTYVWDDEKVKGIGVLIGHRFYLAYGGEHIALSVGAPLRLTSDETPAYQRYVEVRLEAARRGREEHEIFEIKNAPWFKELYMWREGLDPVPAHYFLWFEAKGGQGYTIYQNVAEWSAGDFPMAGWFYGDDGKDKESLTGRYHGTLRIAEMGRNSRVEETGQRVRGNDWELDGVALDLPDGTVVMLLGGNDDAGVGWYDIVGTTFRGPYATHGAEIRGLETLTPDPAIVARNPKLFGGS
jgi:hypothetical protein